MGWIANERNRRMGSPENSWEKSELKTYNTNTAENKMGVTKGKQRKLKKSMDEKLALSRPPRELLESLAVDCASKPSSNSTFQYAFALAKSEDRNELKYAVSILDGLVNEGYEHQVDCMYGAATALYLMEDFEGARVS